ncbi:hypothetical protein ACQP2F_15095 [Actinoplanes sp. CA-030573]|uniref:hypothetical protein n=1 Tax=Actinoplanes sp. CA-030573 TaxID=3239898 RepID=UPI003D939C6E
MDFSAARVFAALLRGRMTPQELVVTDVVAAVELPDVVQLLVAHRQRVRGGLEASNRNGPRADGQGFDLVERAHLPRKVAVDVVIAGHLGVPVWISGLLPSPGPLKADAVFDQQQT